MTCWIAQEHRETIQGFTSFGSKVFPEYPSVPGCAYRIIPRKSLFVNHIERRPQPAGTVGSDGGALAAATFAASARSFFLAKPALSA